MHSTRPFQQSRAVGGVAMLSLAVLAASPISTSGQGLSSGAIPSPGYYVAVEQLYRGEFNRAQRSFRSEVNGAIKTVQARWIDSICYHSMLGETYFQLGRNREALSEFDQAIELYLAYPDWLLRVKQQQQLRVDANRARFVPPWGRSTRQITYGDFSDTMLVAMGNIDNTQVARQGGVIVQAQFWKLDVFELVRTTSLAIRRRNEILGPLAKHDRLSRELINVLSKGNISPPNHWFGSLVDLQLGLAQAGMDNPQQALPHLGRAVLIDGRYDHPLTGVALLAQGLIAKDSGNLKAAQGLFFEASLAAFSYEDFDVINEALWQAHLVHVASGAREPYAPIETAAIWANRSGLDLLTLNFTTAQSEGLMLKGDLAASSAVAQNVPRRKEVLLGIVGIRYSHLQSLLAYMTGRDEIGDKTLAQALAMQIPASIRNFQIARAVELVDAGTFTSRIAVGVFSELLVDPSPADWTYRPLEMIGVLKTDHQSAYDRWFLASLDRKELPRAVEISELSKRRRFFASQALGGRLTALRTVLEAPAETLSRDASLQRRGLMQRFPEYAQLANDSNAMRRQLEATPIVEAATGKPDAPTGKKIEAWAANAARRESVLNQIALRRETVEMSFPPFRTTQEIQEALQPGQAIIVFHQPGDALFAFLIAADGIHGWQLPPVGRLKTRISQFHREIGNFNNQRVLSSAELTSNDWQSRASELAEILFAMSKLELRATTEVAIVPDGPLWFLPFETLPMRSSAGEVLFVEAVPMRYVPLAGLAVGDRTPLSPVRSTAVAFPAAVPSTAAVVDGQWKRFSDSVDHAVRVNPPLSVDSPYFGKLFDQVISLIDSDLSGDASAWSPFPVDRSDALGALPRWAKLPYDSPERMVLAGVRVAVEIGQRSRRRNASRAATNRDGDDLFQAACGLYSTGVRTLLLTRWQSKGAVQEALVREFSSEMSEVPAAEAWQRSVRLARAMPLDASQEPQFRISDEVADSPTADHPFFWAGFVLFDTGRDPRARDAEPQEEERVVEVPKQAGLPMPPVPPQPKPKGLPKEPPPTPVPPQ